MIYIKEITKRHILLLLSIFIIGLLVCGCGASTESTSEKAGEAQESQDIQSTKESQGTQESSVSQDTQESKKSQDTQGSQGTQKSQSSEELQPVKRDLFAMDTYMTLTAYGEEAKEALDEAEEEIKRIENLLSTGISTSEISQINDKGQGDVSEDTSFLIERSKELNVDTGGIFDITIYPFMKAWGFTNEQYRVPSEQELQDLKKLLGSDTITLEHGHVTLGKKGQMIDLGGIAKGYTSDRVIEIFRSHNIPHAVISLGGNVGTLNGKPDGTKWRVAVEDPKDTSSYIGIIEVENKAVITSGGYERYFEQDGKTYHHIIDPATGYPADKGLSSVTIVSEDGTYADGLSTSLFIMGKEKAIEYWRGHKELFDMVLVEENGHVSVSSGIADVFTGRDDWEKVE
jgi:thiamine biosynthesis lipoprotein